MIDKLVTNQLERSAEGANHHQLSLKKNYKKTLAVGLMDGDGDDREGGDRWVGKATSPNPLWG